MMYSSSMMRLILLSSVLLILVAVSSAAPPTKPNFIFVLTDDQDLVMDSSLALPKTSQLIAANGAVLSQSYVTTPVCCPSRSSIWTGKYQHNTRAFNNSADGGCFGEYWKLVDEKQTIAVHLKQNGYRTSYAGKYLNEYLNPNHVPPGWDNWQGLLGNSIYYNYGMSNNGVREHHGHNYEEDYFTDIVKNRTKEFLVDTLTNHSSSPFFAVVATPACHDPETPAPQYANLYANLTVPRIPSWNYHSKGNESKHWLVDWEHYFMSNDTIDFIDEKYRNRLRTLASVDDIVSDVVEILEKHNQLNNTYIIFFSDNGYHLGHFCMVYDKRQPYEFDIHVPFFIRGPGIARGSSPKDLFLNIDFAPTILDLAGVQIPKYMDGRSMKNILLNQPTLSQQQHINNNHNNAYTKRTDFLVEYVGEYSKDCFNMYHGCCANNSGNMLKDHWCVDSINNTYICLRTIDGATNTLYCEFRDTVGFKEYYDLNTDPYQLSNAAYTVSPKVLAPYQKRIANLKNCVGAECNMVLGNNVLPNDKLIVIA